MSKRPDADLLEDILISMKKIKSYVADLLYDDFVEDEKTQDAVIRNIEIIGEAVKRLSEDIKEKKQHIPWRKIAGTRDHLIHGYFGNIVYHRDSGTRRIFFPSKVDYDFSN